MATLKQSVIWPRKFMMVLSSDHITGATGKTVSIQISRGPGTAGFPPQGTITELDSTNMPGWYQIAYAVFDTNAIGDLVTYCTASGCDPTILIDQVQTTVFSDWTLTGGRGAINAALVQKAPFSGLDFLMVNSSGAPATGLTVAAQVSLAGAAFVAAHNTPTELSNGIYTHTFVAADLNANMIMARYTATGAADRNIGIVPTP